MRGVAIGGSPVRLSRRRAFIAVFAGARTPRVEVTYAPGAGGA